MRITKLELENFKRFTKLTIDMTQLSTPPKLVLLIGANGSGKSSLFDALNYLTSLQGGNYWQNGYYIKSDDSISTVKAIFDDGKFLQNANGGFKVGFVEKPEVEPQFNLKGKFYGRTSLRQIPRLTRLGIKNGFNIEEDSDRPLTWIDRDERFENDVERTTKDLLELFLSTTTITNEQVRRQFINPINDAFRKIFADSSITSIRFISIAPPSDGSPANILFKKGESIIHYNFLSSGEKEVFNILLDLSVRGKYYRDSIYFIDEMDLHLEYNTQVNLLKEITENWIPENCQLWTASHSLGFIKYANESEHAAIIDLDNLDFDLEQVIYPSAKDNSEVYEIAVDRDFLAGLFKGKHIVFAEGEDAGYYNPLQIDDYIFIKAKNKNDVFFRTVNDTNFKGVIDRDYLSDLELEVIEKRYPTLFLLKYYSIENYLFHPDNLQEYFIQSGKQFDREAYLRNVITVKNDNLDSIKLRLYNSRSSYPFFKEKEGKDQLEMDFKNMDSALPLVEMLNSNDFETFYKVFPAKDYGKTLPERQNLSKHELGRTKWFKHQIEKVLKK